mmetsp:Transcript_3412/g.5318  ORF Transcript_3412/g.5318 Transcript_3412/m.5318 type:complete len:178 (-) Transcript_3412:64-597(-)
MESKQDFKNDGIDSKSESKGGDEGGTADSKDTFADDKEISDDNFKPVPPTVNVTSICIQSGESELTSSLKLDIDFELDRDCVASYWVLQFLVDCTNKRIIKILGKTEVEDFPDGDSSMSISVDSIDVSDVSPSTLANSGLLMAVFMVDGEEVASVNMVVNVTKKDGLLMRQIFNPLE